MVSRTPKLICRAFTSHFYHFCFYSQVRGKNLAGFFNANFTEILFIEWVEGFSMLFFVSLALKRMLLILFTLNDNSNNFYQLIDRKSVV